MFFKQAFLTLTFLCWIVLSGHCFVLDVNLIQYHNPTGVRTTKQCCDVDPLTGECAPPCDLSIRMCLRVGGHSTDKGNRGCDWNSVTPRVVITEPISADFIIFNNTIGGVSNPISFSFTELPATGIQLFIQPRDIDGMNSQVIDRIFTEIPPDMLGNGSQLLSVVGDTNTTSFIFAYNLHCANNYFGNNCSIFCIAQDDEFGHFTCHEDSGGRICLPGYTGVNCSDVVEPCQLEPSPKNTTCSNSFVRNTCNHFTECAQPPSITSSLTPSNSLLETVPSQQQTLILPSSKLNMLSMLPDMTSENAPILLTGFASNIVASTHTSIRSTFANSAVTDTSSILLFPSSTLSPVENSMLSISINPTSLSSLVAIISETVESEQVSSLVHIFQTSSSYYASAAVNTLSSNGATSWFVRMEETSTIFLSSSNATFPSLSGSVTMTMTTIVPTSASHLSEPFPVTSSHHPLTQLSRLPHTPLPSMVGKGDGPFSVTSSSFSPLQSPWNEIVAPLLTEAGFPVTNPPSPLVQQQNSMSSSSRQINTVTVLPQLAATMSALVPSGHTIASVLSESSGSSFLPLEQLISSPLSTNQDTVSLNSVSQQAVLSQELSRQQSTAYLYIYASHSPTLMTTSSELEPTFTIYTSTPIHMLTRFPSANMTTTPTTMKSLAGNEMVTASILLPNSLLSNLFSSSTLALSSFASMGAHSSFSSIKQSFSPALKTSSPVTQSSQPLLTLARLHSESGALQATFLSQHIREVFPTITTIVSDTSNDGGMVSTTFKFQTITLSKSPPPTSQLDLTEEFSSPTGQSHSTRELSMGPSPLPQMAASNPSLHSNSKNLISTVESTMASSDIIRRSMITHSEAFPPMQISQNTISSALTMTQIVCQSLSTLSSNEGTISNHKSAVTEGTVSGADNIAAITSGVAIAGVLVIIVGIMIVVSIALYVTNKPENFLFGQHVNRKFLYRSNKPRHSFGQPPLVLENVGEHGACIVDERLVKFNDGLPVSTVKSSNQMCPSVTSIPEVDDCITGNSEEFNQSIILQNQCTSVVSATNVITTKEEN